MTIKKISILVIFVIFVMVIHIEAKDVKSIKYGTNRETIIKMDENTVRMQKTEGPPKEPARSMKKPKTDFQSGMLFDHGRTPENRKYGVDFLKVLSELKKSPLRDTLYKVIYSYHFSPNIWRDKSLNSGEINGAKPSNSGFGPFISKQDPTGDSHIEEGKIPSTFKLPQSKKEETFKEIFMGFCLSFDQKSTHMHIEVNLSPSSEKGSGVIIPF